MFEAKKIKKIVMSVFMAVATIGVCSQGNEITVSRADGFDTSAGLSGIEVKKDEDTGKFEITGADDSTTGALNSALEFIKWISMAGTLLLLGVFIINLLKLGSSGTNVQARAAAQQGLVWSGISAAVLSIASTVFFFISGALTGAANSESQD